MKRIPTLVFLISSTLGLIAQEPGSFGVKFSGFVKADYFYDTRQTVAAREGHFLLWPSPESLDPAGKDINARPGLNMLAIQSQLKASITGPDAFGAKTSAVIEADFFATTNETIDLLRMRHAFARLRWEKLEVLAGQYWNPFFVTDCFPGTVSFNTGAPLQSFARNPQLRLTYYQNGLRFILAGLAQRDYATFGPLGASSQYLRNAALPDIHFQMHYGAADPETGLDWILGAGAAWKAIVPRLSSSIGDPAVSYQVRERVNGFSALLFSRIKTKPLTIKLEARYGENISDLLAVSGYAVKDIADPTTGEFTYTPLKSMTYWGEVHTNGKTQFGVFGGYLINQGSREAMHPAYAAVFGLAPNIRSLMRVSPRVIFTSGKTRLAFELEYTEASYGRDYDEYYVPEATTKVANLRALAALYYHF